MPGAVSVNGHLGLRRRSATDKLTRSKAVKVFLFPPFNPSRIFQLLSPKIWADPNGLNKEQYLAVWLKPELCAGEVARPSFSDRLNPFFVVAGALQVPLFKTFHVSGFLNLIGNIAAYLLAQ